MSKTLQKDLFNILVTANDSNNKDKTKTWVVLAVSDNWLRACNATSIPLKCSFLKYASQDSGLARFGFPLQTHGVIATGDDHSFV